MNSPRLSIIIATYNAFATLDRCIGSILEQKFTNWELLIADGASTDGTINLIRKHEAHIAWWQSKSDRGIYDAWNQALANARGQYICFLGADDAWSDSNALKAIFDAIGERTPDLISGKGLVVDSMGQSLATIGQLWSHKRIRRRMCICHPGALHSRQLFEAYGPFDTNYRIAADYDWMLRLPASTYALFVDRVVIHVQDGGVSRQRRWRTMTEYWSIQARNPRVGKLRATLTYIDRLWRPVVARMIGLHY